MNMRAGPNCGERMKAWVTSAIERLRDPDVAVGVLVAGEPVAAAAVEERRVDEADVRQLPGGRVGVELGHRPLIREALGP